MAPLRPFLILALLAWISLADQGMGVTGGHLGQCRVGRLPGLGSIKTGIPSRRVMQGPLRAGVCGLQEVSV